MGANSASWNFFATAAERLQASNDEVDLAREAITNVLGENGPRSPSEVISRAVASDGLEDATVRAALWELLRLGKIEFTHDRKLRLVV